MSIVLKYSRLLAVRNFVLSNSFFLFPPASRRRIPANGAIAAHRLRYASRHPQRQFGAGDQGNLAQ
jgi:hypothetical protein